MQKVKVTLVTMIIVVFVSNFTTYACWAYLSVDELFTKSDVIIIGEVIGKTGRKISDKSAVGLINGK